MKKKKYEVVINNTQDLKITRITERKIYFTYKNQRYFILCNDYTGYTALYSREVSDKGFVTNTKLIKRGKNYISEFIIPEGITNNDIRTKHYLLRLLTFQELALTEYELFKTNLNKFTSLIEAKVREIKGLIWKIERFDLWVVET